MTDVRTSPIPQSRRHGPLLVAVNSVAAIAAVFLFDLFSPLHGSNLRLMPDQDFFQLVGKVWAEGGVPYRDIWDQKGPFIFFVNMLGWKLTGNGYGIVIIECVFLLATMWFLWLTIGTILEHERHDSSESARHYATSILTLWICVLWIAICMPGSWNMTEMFCLPFLAASAWLLLRSLFEYQNRPADRGTWHIPGMWAYVHGLAFGVCFMTRLSNAIGVCVSLLVLTVLLVMRCAWKNLGTCILGFLAGVATFFVPFAIYFAVHGVFYEFMYGTVLYNLHYAGGLGAAAGIPGLTTLALVFIVPAAMLMVGIVRTIQRRAITCGAVFLMLGSVAFAVLFFQMFAIQTGSYLHYTLIDVVFLPMVLIPATFFLRSQWPRIAALVCAAALLLGYAGLRTRQVMTWPEFDNTWVAQLTEQSQGSIAFYNMNSLAYTLNDVIPAYPYAVFQDWQAEFSSDMRTKIIDSYTQPSTEILVVQQYGDLTPVITDVLNAKYQFVSSITDDSGTYSIYQRI